VKKNIINSQIQFTIVFYGAIGLVLAVLFRVYQAYTMPKNNFKDVGPFQYAGFGDEGMYLMAQQRIAQSLNPNYAAPLSVEHFAPVAFLAPNGVRPLET
jgi:hypothetical protein